MLPATRKGQKAQDVRDRLKAGRVPASKGVESLNEILNLPICQGLDATGIDSSRERVGVILRKTGFIDGDQKKIQRECRRAWEKAKELEEETKLEDRFIESAIRASRLEKAEAIRE